MSRRRTLLQATATAAAALWAPALLRAQTPADAGRVRDLALFQGADREARLLDAAKKEGELSIYHVYPALPVVVAAFTKKYGLKTRAWRAGSEAVLQRLMAETQGNRFDADIVQNNAPEAEAAWREKLTQEFWSPGLAGLLPAAVPQHHGWAGITLDIWTAAYNTNLVRKDELPRSYADLTDPRWKGRLAIEANNHVWFGTLLHELGDAQGLKLFEQIIAVNGISARKGHSVLANLVASGDVPLALTVYSWIPEQLKKKGAPIDNHVIQPLLAQPSTIALTRRASNPATALLLIDFMLGEGQKLLADAQFVPASRALPAPLGGARLLLVDPGRAIDQQDRWLKLFDDAVVKKAR